MNKNIDLGSRTIFPVQSLIYTLFYQPFHFLKYLFFSFFRLERWHSSLGVSAFLIAVGLFLFTLQSTQLDFRGFLNLFLKFFNF